MIKEEKPTIKLYIPSSEKEMQFIKKINKIEGRKYSKEDNSISLYISDKVENGDKVYLSGYGVAKGDGKKYSFSFDEKELKIETVKNKKLYDGVIELELVREGEKFNGLLDITTTDQYNKATISLTIINPDDES